MSSDTSSYSSDEYDSEEFAKYPFTNIIKHCGESEFIKIWNSDPVQSELEKAVKRYLYNKGLDNVQWKKRDSLWDISVAKWWDCEIERRVRKKIDDEGIFEQFKKRYDQIYDKKYTLEQTKQAFERICVPSLREDVSPKKNTIESLFWPDGGVYLVDTTRCLINCILDDVATISCEKYRGQILAYISNREVYRTSILLSCLDYMGYPIQLSERHYFYKYYL